MKIWYGFGSEHSANLVIIGHFKSAAEANDAINLINGAISAAAEDRDSGELEPEFKGGKFTKRLRAFLNEATQGSYANFQYGDQGELLYDIDVEQDGDKVVITTDDLPIAPITKLLMNNGAKVEVYSAHDHKSKYGRQTFEE